MIFDGHSDIFSDVRYKREAGEKNVLQKHHLKRLRQGGIGGGCFVIWADTLSGRDAAAEMAAIQNAIAAEMAEAVGFRLIHDTREYLAAEAAGDFAILLGIEGLMGIGADLDRLYDLYAFGCRHAMLTWNEENLLATGVRGNPERGLTPLGRKALRLIQEQGMILDVSHLNERSFWDVMGETTAPLLASHSNARALAGAKRNLTDAQLLALRDNGGLVGLNAFPAFLSDEKEKQDVGALVRHGAYIAEKIGVEHLSFGFDFLEFLEGEPSLKGLEDCSRVPLLLQEMKKAGFTDGELEQIGKGNWLRLMERILD